MTEQEKWVEALARLTRKTLEGEIRWVSVPPIGPDRIEADKAFETTFRGQRIRVYRKSPSFAERVILGSRAVGHFTVEFLDTSGEPAYRPPFLDGAKDLFSAIEEQAAPAGRFLEVLLHD